MDAFHSHLLQFIKTYFDLEIYNLKQIKYSTCIARKPKSSGALQNNCKNRF